MGLSDLLLVPQQLYNYTALNIYRLNLIMGGYLTVEHLH